MAVTLLKGVQLQHAHCSDSSPWATDQRIKNRQETGLVEAERFFKNYLDLEKRTLINGLPAALTDNG